jgi:hypothetical protein
VFSCVHGFTEAEISGMERTSSIPALLAATSLMQTSNPSSASLIAIALPLFFDQRISEGTGMGEPTFLSKIR